MAVSVDYARRVANRLRGIGEHYLSMTNTLWTTFCRGMLMHEGHYSQVRWVYMISAGVGAEFRLIIDDEVCAHIRCTVQKEVRFDHAPLDILVDSPKIFEMETRVARTGRVDIFSSEISCSSDPGASRFIGFG